MNLSDNLYEVCKTAILNCTWKGSEAKAVAAALDELERRYVGIETPGAAQLIEGTNEEDEPIEIPTGTGVTIPVEQENQNAPVIEEKS